MFYGTPLGANFKSFVWYSPTTFTENGYDVPTDLGRADGAVRQIAADGSKPWCVGIESGDATGWPVTDWIEDVVLRTAGPDVYDQWVNHDIPFNDPPVADGARRGGRHPEEPTKYVNGGFGDVKSIATTTFQDGGLPILDGQCALHRQAPFYAATGRRAPRWPRTATSTRSTSRPSTAVGNPVLGGGEFVAAFTDRPEVQAFQILATDAEYANSRGQPGCLVSANKGLDSRRPGNPVEKLLAEILQDPNAVFRFDASRPDAGAVGAGRRVEAVDGLDHRAGRRDDPGQHRCRLADAD